MISFAGYRSAFARVSVYIMHVGESWVLAAAEAKA